MAIATAQKKASSAKASSKKKKATPAPTMNYKDVQIDYLAEGTDIIRRYIEEKVVTVPVVRRAAKELHARYPEKADLLRAWVEQNYPASSRGRTPPQVGETRHYKSQKVGKSGLFLRLPLDPLGVEKKGEDVAVKFENGRYIVTRVAKDE